MNTRHAFPIHIRTRWLDYSPALHWHTRSHVNAALRALAPHIRWVAVRIADGEGTHQTRACDIDVVLKHGGWVRAFAMDTDAYHAVSAAIRRARTLVRREVERSRETLRRAA